MNKTMIARSIALMAALAAAQGAWASGFQLLEQNASGLGDAFAGSAAVAEDASTIYYNPAGMTKLKDHEFSLGGNIITPSYKFTDNGSSNAPAAAGSNGGDAGGSALVPNAYFSWRLAKDWYGGLGISAPFGLKTEYDNDWVGRFQSTKFDIKTYNINPSLAWRINDKVSVGGGLDWQRMTAVYERYLVIGDPSVPQAFWPATVQKTQTKLDVNDDAWGWNLGGLFTLSPTTTVGLSYRSAIKHKLKGNLSFNGPVAGASAQTTDGDAEADLKLPDTAIMSVTQKLDDTWTMLGDISWTGWGKINTLDILRTSGSLSGTVAQTLDVKFRNTWRVALGAHQKLNDTWKMKYGVAWDQSPVKGADTRLVSLPDNNRLWLTLGTQYKLNENARIDLGGAYLIIHDTTIDNNQTSAGRGEVKGTYKGSVSLIGLQYSQSF